MKTALYIIQFISSVALIFSVLIHPAKTMGMGALGSPSEIFGSQKGAEQGLNRITGITAFVWAVSAVILSTSLVN